MKIRKNRIREAIDLRNMIRDKFKILLHYVNQGFKLVLLHYLKEPGVCSCRQGAHCQGKAKHPCYSKYNTPEVWVGTEKRLRQVYYGKFFGVPGYCFNWGILTGFPSGFFAVDVDSYKGGDETLQPYLDRHGPLPKTVIQKTGGGGWVALLKMANDGRVIPNDTQAKTFGIAIDVKSTGGYIAVFPSIHKSGRQYSWQESNLPTLADIAESPAWVLDLVCTPPPPQLSPAMREAINHRHRELALVHASHFQKWACKVLQGECETIAHAPSGTGNGTLFGSACRVFEKCVETGFLNRSDVRAALQDTADARGGKTSGDKARKTIANAETRVNGKAVYPRPRNSEKRAAYDDAIASNDMEAINSVIDEEFYTDGTWDAPDANTLTQMVGTDFEWAFGDSLEHEFLLSKDEQNAKPQEQHHSTAQHTDVAHAQSTTPSRHRMTAVQQLELELRHIQANHRAKDIPAISDADSKELRLPPQSQPPVSAPTWNRCEACAIKTRPCERCSHKIGVVRSYPDPAPCRRGKLAVIQHKGQSKREGTGSFCFKCGLWNCPKCGFDNEADHLVHHMMISELMSDSSDNPQIGYPSRIVENLNIEFHPIQRGCWHQLIRGEALRSRYINKLSKMKEIGVDFIVYLASNAYLGEERLFHVFITLWPGVDPALLNYRSKEGVEVIPNWCNFADRDTKIRGYLSRYGRDIHHRKSLWEIAFDKIDQKGRHSYNPVSYSFRLRTPIRMDRSQLNVILGTTSPEHEADVLAKYGISVTNRNSRKIDKSHTRGLTQYLLRSVRYTFPPEMSDATIEEFFNELLGKYRQLEPADTSTSKPSHMSAKRCQNVSSGMSCQSSQLIT